MSNNKTFLRITNTDIYKEIQGLKELMVGFKETNTKSHDAIVSKFSVKCSELDIKASKNRLYSRGAIALSVFTLGWLLSYLISGG